MALALKENASFIIVQLSEAKDILYVGFIRKLAGGGMQYDLKRFRLPEITVKSLDGLVELQTAASNNYSKTPILTLNDLNSLESECQTAHLKVRDELEVLISPYLEHLHEYLHVEPKQEEAKLEENPGPGQGQGGKPGQKPAAPKEAPKRPDPKAGKRDQPVEEKGPTTKSGIETVVLLVEESYMLLPFEFLKVLEAVPVLSKDYSLQVHHRRMLGLASEGVQQPLSGKKTQYIAYDLKKVEGENDEDISEIQFSSVVRCLKERSSLELQGVNSNVKTPSIGNWQLMIREAEGLIYYANRSFLNLISPPTLLDLANSWKVKLFVVSDRVNPIKKFIKKSEPLEKEQEQVALSQLPRLTLALLTMLGSSTILCNKGTVHPEQNLEIMYDTLSKMTGDGSSISAALAYARKGRKLNKTTEGKLVKALSQRKEDAGTKAAEEKGGKEGKDKNAGSHKKPVVQDQGEEVLEAYNYLAQSHYCVVGVPSLRLTHN